MLEGSCWEISENYLGVALIKSGDSVINRNEVVLHMRRHMKQKGWNREKNSSLSIRQMIGSGLFYAPDKPLSELEIKNM